MFTHIVCLSSAALIGFVTCHFLWKITSAENVVETEKPWKDALEKEKKSRRDWEDKWSSLYVDFSRRELDLKSLQEQVLGVTSAASSAHEDEVNRLTSFLHEKETQIVSLESTQKQISEKLAYDDEKIALLSAQVEQLTPLEAHLSLKESTIRQLEVEVTTLQKKIPAIEIQVCQLRSEKEAALSQLRTRTNALKEAEAALKVKKASKPTSPAPAIAPLRAKQQPTSPVAVAAAATKVAVAKPQKFVKDDLKLIHGIGPKTESLLNKMSIYRFKQIAQWSSDDVTFFSGKLNGFPNRIKEDNWILSAKKQHVRKYGKKA